MDVEASLDHFASKPLLGYQLDASHLHAVLKGIVRSSQEQAQAINALVARVGNVETHVEGLNQRVAVIENAIGKFGGADELALLRQNLIDVAKATDQVTQSALPQLKRELDQTARKTDQCTAALQQVAGAVPQLEQASNVLKEDIEALTENAKSSNDLQRQMAQQLQQLAAEHGQRERSIVSQAERAEQQLREIQVKADRIERDVSARLGQQLEELNRRTNDNFMQVESSARAVDAELNRLRTDIANVRAEMNTFDNDTRFKFSKVTDDVDSKFNMLLGAMQNLERNSSQLDTVLMEAGRALAHTRAPSNPPTPLYGAGGVTTTTTTLGDGGLSGRVQRSFSNDLDRQGSAPRPNFRML